MLHPIVGSNQWARLLIAYETCSMVTSQNPCDEFEERGSVAETLSGLDRASSLTTWDNNGDLWKDSTWPVTGALSYDEVVEVKSMFASLLWKADLGWKWVLIMRWMLILYSEILQKMNVCMSANPAHTQTSRWTNAESCHSRAGCECYMLSDYSIKIPRVFKVWRKLHTN